MEADYLSTRSISTRSKRTQISKLNCQSYFHSNQGWVHARCCNSKWVCKEWRLSCWSRGHYWAKTLHCKAHPWSVQILGAKGKVKQMLDCGGLLIAIVDLSSKGKMSSTRTSRAGLTSKLIQLLNDIETTQDKWGKQCFLDSTQLLQQYTGSLKFS